MSLIKIDILAITYANNLTMISIEQDAPVIMMQTRKWTIPRGGIWKYKMKLRLPSRENRVWKLVKYEELNLANSRRDGNNCLKLIARGNAGQKWKIKFKYMLLHYILRYGICIPQIIYPFTNYSFVILLLISSFFLWLGIYQMFYFINKTIGNFCLYFLSIIYRNSITNSV